MTHAHHGSHVAAATSTLYSDDIDSVRALDADNLDRPRPAHSSALAGKDRVLRTSSSAAGAQSHRSGFGQIGLPADRLEPAVARREVDEIRIDAPVSVGLSDFSQNPVKTVPQ